MEFRVKAGTGEAVLASGDVFRSEEFVLRERTTERGNFYVGVAFKSQIKQSVVGTLREVGALANPGSHPMRIYSGDTMLKEVPLSDNFAETVQAGEWGGRLGINVETRSAGRELIAALKAPLWGGTLKHCS